VADAELGPPSHRPLGGVRDDVLVRCGRARSHSPGWCAVPARTRSEIVYRTHQLVLQRSDLLAEVMTLEMGKPLAEARGEVGYAADLIRWLAEEAVRIDGGYSGTIRKLSFTGSTAVGKLLLAQAANHVIRTSMVLGGNASPPVSAPATLAAPPQPRISPKPCCDTAARSKPLIRLEARSETSTVAGDHRWEPPALHSGRPPRRWW
jgi:acyl-CoA reductase-like NAD-dependent aldehyde dehydrogenase